MFTSAIYPLNDVSLPADGVILQSADGIQFKIYKNILALASPFFRDMFMLPQPVGNSTRSSEPILQASSSDASSLPVIEVPENSDTLDILLRLIYPLSPPAFPGTSASGTVNNAQSLVRAVDPVLAAALKYDMPLVVKALCTKLLDAANTTAPDGSVVDATLALRVFALACRYKLKEEARAAAHAALRGRTTGIFFDELRDMSAAQYFYLVQFHDRVASAVLSLSESGGLRAPYSELIKCDLCVTPYSNLKVAQWWDDYTQRATQVLRLSPRSDQVFSSSFLAASFKKADSCGSRNDARNCKCSQVHGNWQTLSQHIKERVQLAVDENDIDLSEV
ncbi:hypothetical protein DFH11DRAFT_1618243 [Phellopilus nigrolimitatus]|nr:hypothetical protein DFH11DRAFT_1618243 [Phellopilus nigrolimitatus]